MDLQLLVKSVQGLRSGYRLNAAAKLQRCLLLSSALCVSVVDKVPVCVAVGHVVTLNLHEIPQGGTLLQRCGEVWLCYHFVLLPFFIDIDILFIASYQ